MTMTIGELKEYLKQYEGKNISYVIASQPCFASEIQMAMNFVPCYNNELKTASVCCSDDPTRRILQYVYVTEDKVVGSDGRRLCVLKNNSHTAPGLYDRFMRQMDGNYPKYQDIIPENTISEMYMPEWFNGYVDNIINANRSIKQNVKDKLKPYLNVEIDWGGEKALFEPEYIRDGIDIMFSRGKCSVEFRFAGALKPMTMRNEYGDAYYLMPKKD